MEEKFIKRVCPKCNDSFYGWNDSECESCYIKRDFKKGDQNHGSRIICPACGKSWDGDCSDGTEWEEECPECGEYFDVEVEFSPTFMTSIKKEQKGD